MRIKKISIVNRRMNDDDESLQKKKRKQDEETSWIWKKEVYEIKVHEEHY